MAETEKKLTGEERRIKRIAQIKATLQKEESLLNQGRRKKRNGQLIAFGVLIEQAYKTATSGQREWLKKATELLDDRNKTRALEGFDRLSTELVGVGVQDMDETEGESEDES